MSDPNLTSQRQILALQDDLERLRKADTGTPSGAAFPASPTTGYVFFRTDLGWECYYDGTRWLTVNEFTVVLGMTSSNAVNYAATTQAVREGVVRNDYKPVFTRIQIFYQTGATNTGANYFTYDFVDSGGTTLYTFNTSANAPSTDFLLAIGFASITQPGAAIHRVYLNMTTTGAPTAQYPRAPAGWYRLVIT